MARQWNRRGGLLGRDCAACTSYMRQVRSLPVVNGLQCPAMHLVRACATRRRGEGVHTQAAGELGRGATCIGWELTRGACTEGSDSCLSERGLGMKAMTVVENCVGSQGLKDHVSAAGTL